MNVIEEFKEFLLRGLDAQKAVDECAKTMKRREPMRRPVTCEVDGCSKRVRRVIGYYHKWAERVHMQKGMIPCYSERLFFVCDIHNTDGSSEECLGIFPVVEYDNAVQKAEISRDEMK